MIGSVSVPYILVCVFQAAGSQASLLVQSFANMGTALVIAFIFGWKLAFVVLLFLPILMLSGLIQGRMTHGRSKQNVQALEEGAQVADKLQNLPLCSLLIYVMKI